MLVAVRRLVRFALVALVLSATFGVGAGELRAAGLNELEKAIPEGLPKIKSHSLTEFAVYKGDTVELEVEASGVDLAFKWIRAKNVFCREATCSIDTSDWGLGSQKVTFIIVSPKGSLYLRYTIKVLAPPAGYKVGRVKPEMIDAGEKIETVTEIDLAVKTLSGRGFSYHNKKLQVVGPTARALDWGEKLRTQDESTMQIARDGKEHHVLGPATSVYLAKSDSGRRAIVLSRGLLRSRQLDRREPSWSILYGNWLQIDANETGDVIVRKPRADREEIELLVLRGAARVFRRKASADTGGDNGVAGEAIAVPQGGVVRLTREFDQALRIEYPTIQVYGPLVAETTPLYMPGQNVAKDAPGTMILGAEDRPKDFAAAVKKGAEAVAKRDFPLAVEVLQPFTTEAKKSYRAALTIGKAYLGMLQRDAAITYLSAAARLRKKDGEPHFLLGEAELGEGRWKRAYRHLRKADDLDYPDQQTLAYYLGVASYHVQEYVAARNALTRSLWAGGDAAVDASADAFRRKVRFDGWFDLRLSMGLLFDSNVVRAGERHGEPLPQKIAKKGSAGFLGGGGFSVWAFRSEQGHLGLTFDADKLSWFEKTLAKVGTLKERIALEFGVNAGAKPELEESQFELGLTAEAGTLVLGDQRAMDTVGGRVRVALPTLAHLTLTTRSLVNVDPLPGRDDVLDPILMEIVATSDRSNRQNYYGLSLRPVDLETIDVELKGEFGDTILSEVDVVAQSFKETKVGVGATVEPSRRTDVAVDLDYLMRDFPVAAAGTTKKRSDKVIELAVGWSWSYTTSLSHYVHLLYEKQSSNVEEASFGRTGLGYKVTLDL